MPITSSAIRRRICLGMSQTYFKLSVSPSDAHRHGDIDAPARVGYGEMHSGSARGPGHVR